MGVKKGRGGKIRRIGGPLIPELYERGHCAGNGTCYDIWGSNQGSCWQQPTYDTCLGCVGSNCYWDDPPEPDTCCDDPSICHSDMYCDSDCICRDDGGRVPGPTGKPYQPRRRGGRIRRRRRR